MNFNFGGGVSPQVGSFGPGGFSPQFQPSGRQGLGGTQIPLPNDISSRSLLMAQTLAPQMKGANRPPAGYNPRPGFSSASPQARAAAWMGPGGMGTIQRNDFQPSMQSARQQVQDFTGGGVRPGARPEMNAVQAARMAGPPPGADGAPQGAALRGYR
jgi:hypothetical protein